MSVSLTVTGSNIHFHRRRSTGVYFRATHGIDNRHRAEDQRNTQADNQRHTPSDFTEQRAKANGLIRKFLPKSYDGPITHEMLENIQHLINNRPRKILGWKSPAELINRCTSN